MDAAIDVRNLAKTYPGDVRAVRDISFDVAPGEVFGLLGPNGAGKSTTVGMLTTTIVPSSGGAWLAGVDVVREPLAARAVSSVVFQESVVDQALSGRRNLEIHASLWRVGQVAARTRIDELGGVLGSAICSTDRLRPTAAASAAGSRSPARSSRARASCSSTSRPSASTRASAPSCST